MAKPFGKRTRDWLITQQSKDLMKVVSEARNLASTDLQLVKKGGKNQGTWFQKEVALFFAQWLSPEFYLACNLKLEELLTQNAIALPEKHGITATVYNGEVLYPYNLACKKLGSIKYPKAALRKRKNPSQFRTLFGRNFITGKYLDLLKGYYDCKNATNQLKLSL